ncbi:MAG: preprotein translocase subunit SecE [Thermodesulfobacteriota bacterium]
MTKIDRTKQFFAEARQELKKVTWPTKQQTMNSTWVVIAVTALLSAFMGIVDMGFSKIIGMILK